MIFEVPPQVPRNPKGGLQVVTTPQGGKFWADDRVLSLLEFARGKTFEEIRQTFSVPDSGLTFPLQETRALKAIATIISHK